MNELYSGKLDINTHKVEFTVLKKYIFLKMFCYHCDPVVRTFDRSEFKKSHAIAQSLPFQFIKLGGVVVAVEAQVPVNSKFGILFFEVPHRALFESNDM